MLFNVKNIVVTDINKNNNQWGSFSYDEHYFCNSLIIATGGLSVPKIGASKFGYDIAKKFNLNIIEPCQL